MNSIKIHTTLVDIEKWAAELMQINRPSELVDEKGGSKEIPLASCSSQSLENIRPGAKISVLDGTVWITQTNDPQDYILGSGESMEVPRAGRIVAQGFPQARLRIENGTG